MKALDLKSRMGMLSGKENLVRKICGCSAGFGKYETGSGGGNGI